MLHIYLLFLQDHLIRAYDDWENTPPPTLDPSRLHAPHHFPSASTLSPELLPPPPLSADNPFPLESLAACHSLLGPVPAPSAFKTVATGFTSSIPPAFQVPGLGQTQASLSPQAQAVLSPMSLHPQTSLSPIAQASLSPNSTSLSTASLLPASTHGRLDNMPPAVPTPLASLPINFSTAAVAPASMSLAHNIPPPPPPPCSRPVPVGGNAAAMPVGKEQRTYAQPCKKYSSQARQGKAMTSQPAPPPISGHPAQVVQGHNPAQHPGGGKMMGKTQLRQPVPDPPHSCAHNHVSCL